MVPQSIRAPLAFRLAVGLPTTSCEVTVVQFVLGSMVGDENWLMKMEI